MEIRRAIIRSAIERGIQEIRSDPQRGVRKLVDLGTHFSRGRFQKRIFREMQDELVNPNTAYYAMVTNLVNRVRAEHIERLGIDTLEVLEAAGTKWNFLPFRPGLVGGHCIGVDPYYLTFKAEEMGFHPEVILAGRRTNDNMGKYVAECLVKRLIKNGNVVSGARVGILGFTFKENVPDLRNTRVVDVIRELTEYNVVPLVHDAEADPAEAMREYGQELVDLDQLRDLDAVLLAVSHKAYAALTPEDIKARCKDGNKAVLMDVKGFFDPQTMRAAGIDYWRL